ncbi:alpha/beta hydrolase [Nakamurella endophytica]|uniref:alpha/beta hydrolase n=1 Tax=Nakamurella endophytica TaxID=1748367 RepID=UPI001668683C|nr:alpha/beta hydrolase [Nakamurella endophytica]
MQSSVDLFDDEDSPLADLEHPAYAGIRLPDGRALTWAEYGSPRGFPCILLPDDGSSRLAPSWLLHDSALPSAVRLLAVDRPGSGASDAVGLGGHHDPASDLRRLIETLAVGRVALIGIGRGADEAFAVAARHPQLVASVTGVSVRLERPAARRGLRRRLRGGRGGQPVAGIFAQWAAAAAGADLAEEATWQRAVERMPEAARTALGDRWREADFRAAVAADAVEGRHEWSGIDEAVQVAPWAQDPASINVPVHLWHGRHEWPSTLGDVQSAVGGRPGWRVSPVSGPSAALGFWPQILQDAVTSFRPLSPA